MGSKYWIRYCVDEDYEDEHRYEDAYLQNAFQVIKCFIKNRGRIIFIRIQLGGE